ncbi:MAG: tetratricopeptide repeat protein [Treponema sp.]|jgi:tetratricopeptide (TPR) repeat protein|nr:tetratricopeptide repeat protein [Treponema sp.]
MRLEPVLEKAIRFIRQGGYDRAIRILEPEASRYRGSYLYYYLLAAAYLNVRDFKNAKFYFDQALKSKQKDTRDASRDPGILLGFAALYLHRGDTAAAVDYYLEILDDDENNKIAEKALRLIKKYSSGKRLSDWMNSTAFRKIFPQVPKIPLTWNRILIPVLIGVLGISAGVTGVLIWQEVIPSPWNRVSERDIGEAALDRAEKANPVETGGVYRYILTRDQVLDEYGRALSLFSEFRDEQARVRINRLLESNASDPVKNKVRILASFMEKPGFDSFRRGDNFSYSEVMKDPLLYRDCGVIWRGMATNVRAEEGSFDFLVGYDKKTNLEGIVEVKFPGAVNVNSEEALELLGRIVPVSSPAGLTIAIEGISIHQNVTGRP